MALLLLRPLTCAKLEPDSKSQSEYHFNCVCLAELGRQLAICRRGGWTRPIIMWPARLAGPQRLPERRTMRPAVNGLMIFLCAFEYELAERSSSSKPAVASGGPVNQSGLAPTGTVHFNKLISARIRRAPLLADPPSWPAIN